MVFAPLQSAAVGSLWQAVEQGKAVTPPVPAAAQAASVTPAKPPVPPNSLLDLDDDDDTRSRC